MKLRRPYVRSCNHQESSPSSEQRLPPHRRLTRVLRCPRPPSKRGRSFLHYQRCIGDLLCSADRRVPGRTLNCVTGATCGRAASRNVWVRMLAKSVIFGDQFGRHARGHWVGWPGRSWVFVLVLAAYLVGPDGSNAPDELAERVHPTGRAVRKSGPSIDAIPRGEER